jgi:hypothetical protein
MGVERTGLIMYDADLVDVVRRMGITFSVDRKRVAIDQFCHDTFRITRTLCSSF